MQGSPSFRLPLEVCRLPAVDSTNGWVLARLEILPSVCLVIADRQLHGRGQRGNGWLALEGDLACTLLVKEPPVRPAAQFRLLQMASVAVVDALRQLGIPASIKWPNDILVGRQKICGILLETGIRGAKLAYAAIGIGLNLAPRTPRDSAFPRPATTAAHELMRARTSTTAQIGESRTLQPIAMPPYALGLGVRIACQIVALIASHQWGLPPSINHLYHARLSGVEAPLRYRDAQGEFSAQVVAALPDGRLLLAKTDGSTQAYAFQEIRTLE
ncbi:MAG: biotin--[acetyl-CoA-carboxylase] ligase [Bacteroides sp.]